MRVSQSSTRRELTLFSYHPRSKTSSRHAQNMNETSTPEFEEAFSFSGGIGPDVLIVEPRGSRALYHELSEFVFYFWQPVTTPDGRNGDFYTILSQAFNDRKSKPAKDFPWRADIHFIAYTIFSQDESNRTKKFEPVSKQELRELTDRNKAICEQLVKAKGIPMDLVKKEIADRLDVEETLRFMMKKLAKPHQKMGLWCLASRHVKEKYSMTPPEVPDFGKVIFNKAVRLHLEDCDVIPRASPQPERALPVDEDGDLDNALILSSWAADTCKKDCKSKEEAALFLNEAHAFLRLLPQQHFNSTIRANHKKLQQIYCDEFPEFKSCFSGGWSGIDDLSEDVKKMWKEMPMPDQTNFVERLRSKVMAHALLGGALNETFMRQLNDDIRRGLTEPMYDGWARVFQLRDKSKNMALLKMVIQMAYLCMFIESYREEAVYSDRVQVASHATKRLQEVCDTPILFKVNNSTSEQLAPHFL